MKKITALFFLSFFVCFLAASVNVSASSKQDDPQPKKTWNDYRKAKAEAEEAKTGGDLETITGKLLVVADITTSLERPDITAWQYNNIGYYAIEEFKKKTDYTNLMVKIENTPDKNEKAELIKEAKETIKKNLSILTDVKDYLEKAKKLDAGVAEDRKDEKRTSAIESNISFINWVENFTTEKKESE